MHACDGQTDGQTDSLIATPRLHCMQRCKKYSLLMYSRVLAEKFIVIYMPFT